MIPFLYGIRSSNGKSSVLSLIAAVFGSSASHIECEELLKGEHALTVMDGTLALVIDEVSSKHIASSARLKSLITSERITVNPKFKKIGIMVNTAKIWMASNVFLRETHRDGSQSVARRLYPINFDVVFTDDASIVDGHMYKQCNREIAYQAYTQDELDGFFLGLPLWVCEVGHGDDFIIEAAACEALRRRVFVRSR